MTHQTQGEDMHELLESLGFVEVFPVGEDGRGLYVVPLQEDIDIRKQHKEYLKPDFVSVADLMALQTAHLRRRSQENDGT